MGLLDVLLIFLHVLDTFVSLLQSSMDDPSNELVTFSCVDLYFMCQVMLCSFAIKINLEFDTKFCLLV